MFDDMIAGIQSNKKLSLIVTELILRGKNNISLHNLPNHFTSSYHNLISKYLKL